MTLLQTVVDGLILGGFYALVAQGVALTFGVMRVVNLAHGEMMLVGAYLTWAAQQYLGLDIWVTLPIGIVLGYLMGWLIARLIVIPIVERPEMIGLLLTFGLAFLLQGLLVWIFSTTPHLAAASYADAVWRPFGIDLSVSRLVMFAASLVIIIMLALYLGRTRSGRAIKAASQNKEAARIVGIDVNTVYARAFGIAAGLAFAAGALFSVTQSFTPSTGLAFTIKAFVIVVVAGTGRISATLVAALVIGLVESFLAAYVPNIGTGLGVAAASLLVVVVLAVRPAGISRTAVART